MNDFDRFLELELKDLLDPITERRPPRRGRRRPVLVVMPGMPGLGVEGQPGDPAVVPIPVAFGL